MADKITCMQHWNGDIAASISIKTTGPDVAQDEIIQLSVLVLDSNYRVVQTAMPFDMLMRPSFDITMAEDITVPTTLLNRLMVFGVDHSRGVDYFCNWLEALELPESRNSQKRRRINLLGYDMASVRPFLERWMSRDLYTAYFTDDVRDTRTAALYLNDNAGFSAERVPYSKSEESWIANVEKVPRPEGRGQSTPLQLCKRNAAAYASMCFRFNIM